ncbi:MAG: DUF362 domain-containing protein [Deltaproteobacteria bacterium]|nr:DUF362 domain-containing protein [Deltaproteobacteria bacterium]
MGCASVSFTSYAESVPLAMDRAGAERLLSGQSLVMVKPNLVNATPFPVTTPPELCAAIVEYVRAACPAARVVVAEGTGEPSLTTMEVFDRLGYVQMAKQAGVELVDLDCEPTVTLADPSRKVFPEMVLPEIAIEAFLISAPVLKAHSLAAMTGTLKNMMGLAPASHYSGRGGFWRKAVFHQPMQESVMDLNAYRLPDFTVMDATVGLAEYHLGGATLDPPPNLLLAGDDPYAVDREAAGLLGLDWRAVPHVANRADTDRKA